MNVVDSLKRGVSEGGASHDLARKVFLSYQSKAFEGREDIEYDIKEAIKSHFKIPFISIHVAGSAKTGFSFFKRTLFTDGKSDLDVSIISLDLYNKFLEVAHRQSKGFTDLSVFPNYKNRRTDAQFLDGIKRGFFNPFFMPDCDEKAAWLDFYRAISNRYFKIFKNINAGIYSSEYFFEYKQAECIDTFRENVGIYDSLSSKI